MARISPATLILAAGASVLSAFAQTGVTLAYRYAAGSEVRYLVKAQSRIEGMTVTSERFVTQTVEAVVVDGTATIRVRDTGSRLAVGQIAREFSVGSAISKKIQPNGCVIAYEPIPKPPDALIASDTAALIAVGTSVVVPDHPVNVGETWQTACPPLASGTQTPSLRTEFVGMEQLGDAVLAKVRQHATIPATGAAAALNLDTTAWLDSRGLAVRIEQSADAVPTAFGSMPWHVLWELKDPAKAVAGFPSSVAGGPR
jgi:hypothetical protein